MKRIYPYRIQDKYYLSWLLDYYITALQESPLQVRVKALSYDSGIPESIFYRLMALHKNPDDGPNINAEDLHILFANVMYRFPTVKIWQEYNGHIFLEM